MAKQVVGSKPQERSPDVCLHAAGLITKVGSDDLLRSERAADGTPLTPVLFGRYLYRMLLALATTPQRDQNRPSSRPRTSSRTPLTTSSWRSGASTRRSMTTTCRATSTSRGNQA